MHVEHGVRGWISLLVWLLAAMPEARAAFLVEFNGGRKPVQVHSVISVNPDGVVLRPLGGGFGNGVRHRWDEFTARSLGLLMTEFLKDPVFNQKSRDAKFKIIEALETARSKQAPVVVAPSPKPASLRSPGTPPRGPPTAHRRLSLGPLRSSRCVPAVIHFGRSTHRTSKTSCEPSGLRPCGSCSVVPASVNASISPVPSAAFHLMHGRTRCSGSGELEKAM